MVVVVVNDPTGNHEKVIDVKCDRASSSMASESKQSDSMRGTRSADK